MKVLEFHPIAKPDDGCMFVLGDGTEEVRDDKAPKGFRRVFFTRYCGKGRESKDSPLCPHHALVIAEADEEAKRRMERARKGKERKKLLRDMLAESPLRVAEEKETGYQQ